MGNSAVVKRQVRTAGPSVRRLLCCHRHFDQKEYSTPQVIPDPNPCAASLCEGMARGATTFAKRTAVLNEGRG